MPDFEKAFTAADLGDDLDTARGVVVQARRIAPRIQEPAADSETQEEILAVLRRVYKRAAGIGTGLIASEGRNGTNRVYRDIRSAFWPDDVNDLRSLVPDAAAPLETLPMGSFPADRTLHRLFPEGPYS